MQLHIVDVVHERDVHAADRLLHAVDAVREQCHLHEQLHDPDGRICVHMCAGMDGRELHAEKYVIGMSAGKRYRTSCPAHPIIWDQSTRQ